MEPEILLWYDILPMGKYIMIFRNVGNCSPKDTASYPRRIEFLGTPKWEPEVSQPEGTLPCSHKPTTCYHPEPRQSSLYPLPPFLLHHFNIILPLQYCMEWIHLIDFKLDHPECPESYVSSTGCSWTNVNKYFFFSTQQQLISCSQPATRPVVAVTSQSAMASYSTCRR